MYGCFAFLVTIFWSALLQALPLPFISNQDPVLSDFRGKSQFLQHGRTSFSGQVIAPTCTLAMEDTYQVINMGYTPVRILQDDFSILEKKFRLRLSNCELAEAGRHIVTANHVRVTFDGVQGDTPDRFLLTGQAQGISLQILNSQGYSARAGKIMPPLLLNGNSGEIDYTLRVVRNGLSLKAGDYYASLRFMIDYE